MGIGEQVVFDDDFVLEGVGPGTCFPEVAVAGSTVECRFPLIGRIQELSDWQGAVTVSQDTDHSQDHGVACRFDRTELWCPHVPVAYDPGPVEVSLELDGDTRPLASYEAVDTFEYDFSLFLVGGEEPVAFPDRPLNISLWRNELESTNEAWVLLRRRTREVGNDPFETVSVDKLVLPEVGSHVSSETSVDAPVDPGRYVAVLCVGVSVAECSLVPGHYPFQVIDPALSELVTGHNRTDAARINLVFVGSNLSSDLPVVDLATDLLTIGAPAVLDFENRLSLLDDETDPRSVSQIFFGPFATEPLRSSVDRFNLWYLDADLVDERALFHNSDPEFSRGDELAGFDLPNTAIVTLHLRPNGISGRSESWWTSFRGREDVPTRDEMVFAGAYVSFNAEAPMWAASTLTHELGHALFDLRDEYVEDERSTQYGYPNCAESYEQAEEWWGELEGRVDPFVSEYTTVMQELNFWVPDSLVDDVTVGFVEGGCYGSGGLAVRPTVDGLMNSEIPIFGAVNRARIEDLLDNFEARVDIGSPDDIDLRCFPAISASPGDTVRCNGALARFVDAAPGAIELSMPGQVVRCSVDRVDELGVRGVSCPELTTTGAGPWTIVVSIDDGRGDVVARIQSDEVEEPQPEASTMTTLVETATTEPEGPSDGVAGDANYPLGWVIISGLGALVVAVGGWLLLRWATNDDG